MRQYEDDCPVCEHPTDWSGFGATIVINSRITCHTNCWKGLNDAERTAIESLCFQTQ